MGLASSLRRWLPALCGLVLLAAGCKSIGPGTITRDNGTNRVTGQ